MQNTIAFKHFLFVSATAVGIMAAFLAVPFTTRAYVYNGFKWSSNTVSVDVSDPTWPSAWVTPLAGGLSAWNGASSPFTFNAGSSGHQFKSAANGTGNPLALTTITHTGSTITDCDTVFNTSFTWSTSGAPGAYDVQNTATHELGHWLSLADLSGAGDVDKTMYFSAVTGETKKRTLETDDLNGINAIYP